MKVFPDSRVLVAAFFWATIFGYLSVAAGVRESAARGYADFSTFYTAAKIVRSGQAPQLYDLSLQLRVQREFSSVTLLRNRALPYLRPPFEALLFLPLTYLSYIHAYEFWVILSGLMVLATAALLHKRIEEFALIPWWLYYPIYFAFWPIAYGFAQGQDCALLLFLFTVAMLRLRDGAEFQSGCVLALCLMKFQLVLPLIFILLLKRKMRVVAGFACGALCLFGVAWWMVGWQSWLAYPNYLLRLNAVPGAAGIYPSMMPSVRGLVQGWSYPKAWSPALNLFTGVLIFGLLWWAAKQWNTTVALPRDLHAKFCRAGVAVALLANILAGYHASCYDLAMLSPVAILAASASLRDSSLGRSERLLLFVGATGLLFAPLYLYLALHWNARWNLMALFVMCLAIGFSKSMKTWKSQVAG